MYVTLPLLTPVPERTESQFVKIPIIKIPMTYPSEITPAAINNPLGNVFSGFSVSSTNPPTTSVPPKAKIAKVKKERIAILLVYLAFGETVKA